MDGKRQSTSETGKQIALIRDQMPRVYEAIQAKAVEIGNEAYRLVRCGLRGEANCFYAVEAGHVIGTPFDHAVTPEVAALMVQFGASMLVIWPSGEGDHGTH